MHEGKIIRLERLILKDVLLTYDHFLRKMLAIKHLKP